MKHPNPIIAEMFNAKQFAQTGHELIDVLAAHLEANIAGASTVLNWKIPSTEDSNWDAPLPQKSTIHPQGLLEKLTQEILPNSLAIHHPHNMGHQVACPLPMAALCDLVAALTNQAMAVYEAGPSATMLERQVIRWLSTLIDEHAWSGAGGVLTSGGAQANLTALLVARQVSTSKVDTSSNIWKDGISAPPKLRILASEHAHYSISRAAGVMGLGTDSVIKIATDQSGRLALNALKTAHQACLQNCEAIIAVVANGGCTPTGSIDPLQAIGEYCQAHDLWFHVDGAHGASALLSEKYRKKLSGIELADSVVWDGHKLMYMPAAVSAVLFKNDQHSYAAFSQDATYLFQGDKLEDEAFNLSYRTLECTKRMMALKLWAAFSLYGINGMGALIDEAFAKAKVFAEKIQKTTEFELLMSPETNIVCFRYLKKNSNQAQANKHQRDIRQHIIESGAFHITQVDLHGITWLRTTLMNPFTTEQDLDELLASVDLASQALLSMAE
jgi:L-2,4-diaminobutyrate decarboxylase